MVDMKCKQLTNALLASEATTRCSCRTHSTHPIDVAIQVQILQCYKESIISLRKGTCNFMCHLPCQKRLPAPVAQA